MWEPLGAPVLLISGSDRSAYPAWRKPNGLEVLPPPARPRGYATDRIVPGGGHFNIHAYAGQGHASRRITGFLDWHLRERQRCAPNPAHMPGGAPLQQLALIGSGRPQERGDWIGREPANSSGPAPTGEHTCLFKGFTGSYWFVLGRTGLYWLGYWVRLVLIRNR